MRDFIFIDSETTGLDKPSPCQLAQQPYITELYCVRTDKKLNVVGEFYSLFKVPIPIEEHITKITGIDNARLENEKSFAEKYRNLVTFFIGARTVVGHNVSFDMAMLKYELMRIEKEFHFPWPPERICTVEKSFDIFNKRLKLHQLYEHAFGRTFMNAHTAKADVGATIDCYKWLVEEGWI